MAEMLLKKLPSALSTLVLSLHGYPASAPTGSQVGGKSTQEHSPSTSNGVGGGATPVSTDPLRFRLRTATTMSGPSAPLAAAPGGGGSVGIQLDGAPALPAESPPAPPVSPPAPAPPPSPVSPAAPPFEAAPAFAPTRVLRLSS